MHTFVGLDVSLKETAVCVIDDDDRVLWRGKCASTPEALIATIVKRAPQATRIGLESGPMAAWHWHELHKAGLPVVCIDARSAAKSLSMQLNKTDANDAFSLAQLMRSRVYKIVRVKALDTHLLRARLVARSKLVNVQRDLANQVRGLLKVFGIVIGGCKNGTFERRVVELAGDDQALARFIDPLLQAWRAVRAECARLDRQLRDDIRVNEPCRRFMSIPGVGAIVAASFLTAIDDPARFTRSTSVGAYLGLTPRRYQSGDTDRQGRISKRGDGLTRSYLFEAASVLLTRVHRASALKSWGMRLVRRLGYNRARVAVARKLAVIMHRLWIDNTIFRCEGEAIA